MPKATTPKTRSSQAASSSSAATKTAQRTANNARICELLYEIRHAAGVPKSFSRPAVIHGEYAASKSRIYMGEGDNVNSIHHPRFDQLGQLYQQVCIGSTRLLRIRATDLSPRIYRAHTFVRLAWDVQQIPRHFLEANHELIDLLTAREMLKPPSSFLPPALPLSGSSSSPMVITDDDKSDIEIIDFDPRLNYQRILAQRDRIIADTMSSSPVSSEQDEVEQLIRSKAVARTTITLYVFTETRSTIQSTRALEVKLGVASGSFITLDRLRTTWRPIRWDTPFRVTTNAIMALKLSNVTVKDWKIHAPHIYENHL
ncbi:hypothetical protein BT96DRAFT_991171 [Gymnopus androsaceus JB14]|uniref:Uncharacterized protein n=1 Tax=Gymnopus androsaceus JB14 TaxID=1447944 RepID=A0A6A4HVY0_9AGAR|nr:hypothetical protein BT96DRAFT_991171 [Gymnopus androsaceus JB14]